MIERIYILESVDPVIFYGVNNSNMQLIKTLFPKLRIVARGNVMKVIGDEDESELFLKKIREVEKYCEEFNSLSEDVILDIIKGKGPTVVKQENLIIHGMNGKPITARTENQQLLVKAFENNDLVFATGPAGSGKTFVAIALAVKALKNKEVRKIILSRPAVEAGEKLGFLPGDLQSKVDPYLRPLYDALYQIMGAESFAANMEKGLIEVAPLAYMRGRTLDNAFIILDEAQNTTPAQMKMFLTRIGFGSKVIVTGDSSQKDLPAGTVSGLDVAIKVLSKVDDIGFVKLTNQDVVRHPLVQKIVKAYEDYESRQNRRIKSLVKDKESENKKENTTKRRGRQNDN